MNLPKMATNTSFTNPQSSKLFEPCPFETFFHNMRPSSSVTPEVQESNLFHLRHDVVRFNWPVCLLYDTSILISHTILSNLPKVLDWPRCNAYS
jgi:hypothetical protein